MIGQTRCQIKTEVVDIPLLLSKTSLKRTGAVLDIENDKDPMFKQPVKLELTSSIQFICIAHFHKLQICRSALQSVHVDIPVPEPHIGSGKNPKQPFTGKKGKKPSGEQQRRIPLKDGQVQ